MRRWLLPEYIEDVLPAEARHSERLRRALLDLFRVHGYELVMPPLLEYVESLLTGTGHDLDLRVFKLVDQISGRTLGVRADITPQVARIDAHLLNRNGVTRLCYAGSVLHTLPAGLNQTREPLQVGAEIYGHAGIESDVEVQRLMLDALAVAGVRRVRLDIGHVGVFRALVRRAGVDAAREAELFRAVQAKDAAALEMLVAGIEPRARRALRLLPELCGGPEVLAAARRQLPAWPEVRESLRQLGAVARALGRQATLSFDLGELRGYHYHSGLVFAVYAEGWPNALALGGRYDEVGRAFGRARPATGFTLDLRALVAGLPPEPARPGILAPHRPSDRVLAARIAALRRRGETVIVELPGHARWRSELNCDRQLVRSRGGWRIERRGRARRA